MVLTPDGVKRYYDRSGTFQDRQGFYEDAALDDLVAHAAFDEATAIVELGCGTGRFAQWLLTLSPDAHYQGFDVSTTMLDIARGRLSPLGDRARIERLDPGTVHLPLSDGSADRFVSTYVLDLLPPADIRTVLDEARRVLTPDGRLCLVSLTMGRPGFPWLVAHAWNAVFRLRPQLVGGCRPIEVRDFCREPAWKIIHRRTVVRWGISSEILVATPHVA